MKLHDLKSPKGARKGRRRVGRGEGSGWGKTAGRGAKGQRARTGSGAKPGFEGGQMPLRRRLPKRGFKNPFRVEYAIVNIGALEELFEAGAEITPEVLMSKSMVKAKLPVKILANGKLTKAFNITAHKFSGKAAEAIAAAGGKVVEIQRGRTASEAGGSEESE